MKSFRTKLPFKNEKTFLFFEPVEAIHGEDLLVLDLYAFSLKELQDYAKNSLDTFYQNPHEPAQNFSPAARVIIENHPLLKEYALQYQDKFASQKSGISMATVNAVTELLLEMDNQKAESDPDPRAAFLKYKATLTSDDQEKLDSYVIKVPCHAHAHSNHFTRGEALTALFQPAKLKYELQVKLTKNQERIMTFAEAMVGGNPNAPCRRSFEIFLWQFVLNFNPEAIHKLPYRVKKLAVAEGYLLGTRLEEQKPKHFLPRFSSIAEGDETLDQEAFSDKKQPSLP